jgi:hypothetical protein
MDSLLKTFSIGFLLRSVFAGIFFVVSYYVACYGLEPTIIEAKSISSPALLVALFAGVVVYGVHRSLVYPFIEVFFDSRVGKACRNGLPLISNSTIDTLRWRWNQSTNGAPLTCEQINKKLNHWADFIHLQFTSSLCIVLGVLLSRYMGGHPPCCLIWVAVFLFVAALVSNWRSHSVVDYLRGMVRREIRPEVAMVIGVITSAAALGAIVFILLWYLGQCRM